MRRVLPYLWAVNVGLALTVAIILLIGWADTARYKAADVQTLQRVIEEDAPRHAGLIGAVDVAKAETALALRDVAYYQAEHARIGQLLAVIQAKFNACDTAMLGQVMRTW